MTSDRHERNTEMAKNYNIRDLKFITEIKKVPPFKSDHRKSTYGLIETGAGFNPEAVAITFLRDGESYDEPVETYALRSGMGVKHGFVRESPAR